MNSAGWYLNGARNICDQTAVFICKLPRKVINYFVVCLFIKPCFLRLQAYADFILFIFFFPESEYLLHDMDHDISHCKVISKPCCLRKTTEYRYFFLSVLLTFCVSHSKSNSLYLFLETTTDRKTAVTLLEQVLSYKIQSLPLAVRFCLWWTRAHVPCSWKSVWPSRMWLTFHVTVTSGEVYCPLLTVLTSIVCSLVSLSGQEVLVGAIFSFMWDFSCIPWFHTRFSVRQYSVILPLYFYLLHSNKM